MFLFASSGAKFPAGYVRFDQVRKSLPEPELALISGSVTLEALHLPGPDPPIIFVHGGLGALWNPYPQLYRLRGQQAMLTYALAGNGRSSRRAEQSIEGHARDLQALVDHYDRAIVPPLPPWIVGRQVLNGDYVRREGGKRIGNAVKSRFGMLLLRLSKVGGAEDENGGRPRRTGHRSLVDRQVNPSVGWK